MSPEIDIGQIEGAFMFGLGLWTMEEIKFHPKTGKILTFDTWVGTDVAKYIDRDEDFT